jgi:hypothetical protein
MFFYRIVMSKRQHKMADYAGIEESMRYHREDYAQASAEASALWAYQHACEQARRDKIFTVLKATRHFWRSLLGLSKLRGNSPLKPTGPWFGIEYK